ncbi:MAG: four helix bundle protein [Candidatus Margulisiibacteriota bacterium]
MEESKYGHRKMIVWQNLDKIEQIAQKEILVRIPKNCFSLIDQLDRSCSSSVANFIEGYYSGSIKEYIRFIGYSRRSLAELQDWVRRCFHKGYISENTYLQFDDLAIKTIFLENRLIHALRNKK